MPSKKCLEHIAKRLAEKESGKRKKRKKKKYSELTDEQKEKKEMLRRQRISRTVRKKMKDNFEKKRRAGYRAWLKEKHAEMRKRDAKLKREKEKEKKRRHLESLKKRKYKKKPGKHKKPGPKPKKKVIVPKVPRPKVEYNYKIVSCRNGVQNKFIGKYKTIEDAYDHFKYLKEHNDVIFPVEATNFNTLENSIDEYVLIEKSNEESIMRNEFGKLVEQVTNQEGWRVLDKCRYKKEETFGVYGFNVRNDRKTFEWIYYNLLYLNINSRLDFKRVFTYKNKVIFKDDNSYLDIVFCKCPSDAVRMYNLLQTWVKRDKSKQIIFLGDCSERGERKKKLEQELMEFTGWSKKKIQMSSTSYYNKK